MADSMSHTASERISELEQALADLQTRFLFQEDTLQQLDDAIGYATAFACSIFPLKTQYLP